VKDSDVVVNAANTMPVVASASAPPSESEMDIAELLKPSLSLLDRASVMTLSRGYSRPMPPPAKIQPEMATAAGQLSAVVANATVMAPSTRTEPIRTAAR
jgi:hypothetical protein